MARSIKKGPFCDDHLLNHAQKAKQNQDRKVIKTWSRRSTILPEFVGLTFAVHNGKKFIPVYVTENTVGHKFGEFSPTRQFHGHTPADKKAAADAATTGPAPGPGGAPAAGAKPAAAGAKAPATPAAK